MSASARLCDTITYLEMTEKPRRQPGAAPEPNLTLVRAEPCTPAFYRYLYDAVGKPWLWFERRLWGEERLRTYLERSDIEVSVLYVEGVPAGYFELERASSGDTQLCYFGLMPRFIGRGLGRYFLEAAVDEAWRGGTRRVRVHTSTYDHPRALGLYQRAGFRIQARRDVVFDDPRLTGALPRDVVHPKLPPLPR